MAPDQSERMWHLAYTMARSGEYRSVREIAATLRSRGYPQAPQVLDNKRIRDELDRLCAAARTGNIEA